MDKTNDTYKDFWNYLSQTQKDLILEGSYLMNDVVKHSQYNFKDYSFLVFPYAKAYEGYLKQLFLDLKFISHLDYVSDHFRLGKVLSPNIMERLGERSLYRKMLDIGQEETATLIWHTWKEGRNQIFHYFPHNLRGITFEEAQKIISTIVQTMQQAYIELKPPTHNSNEYIATQVKHEI